MVQTKTHTNGQGCWIAMGGRTPWRVAVFDASTLELDFDKQIATTRISERVHHLFIDCVFR